MPRKRFTAEQIIAKLREAKVELARGRRFYESFNGKLRYELLNGELFETLREAQVLIEQRRNEYNHRRPHSALGYRPPAAPEAISSYPGGFATLDMGLRLT